MAIYMDTKSPYHMPLGSKNELSNIISNLIMIQYYWNKIDMICDSTNIYDYIGEYDYYNKDNRCNINKIKKLLYDILHTMIHNPNIVHVYNILNDLHL